MEDRLESIEKTQNKIQQDVTLIKMCLIGNEEMKIEGVSQKVNRHERYIESDKKQKWMIAGGLGLLTILAKLFKI